MRYIVVFVALLSTSVIGAQPVPPVGQVGDSVASLEEVDQEMIKLLLLREDQIHGYLNVIHTQREAFSRLSDAQWQKQLDLYEGTIEQLRPVLNEVQLAKFSAYLGCLIVEREYDSHLSME